MGWDLIGAGGWGYFRGGLRGYARAFRFAEVNATFYRPIGDDAARRWRASVPVDFVFSVKAHREVTHESRLRATRRARDAFAGSLRTAEILGTPYVVLQTPATLRIGPQEAAGLRDLASLAEDGPRLGLEARAHASGRLPPPLRKVMEDRRILDVVDISRQTPRLPDGEVYTRLFGKGEHNAYEFDDAELRAIGSAAGDAVRRTFVFHGVRMYRDAARFLTFRRTGSFPRAEGPTGLASLECAIAPDARFPAARDALVSRHGWKVVDLDADTRVHAAVLLDRLPARRYASLEDLLTALRPRADAGASHPRGSTTVGGPARPAHG